MAGKNPKLVAFLIAGFAATGCAHAESATPPVEASAPPSRTALTDAELERLEVGVASVHAGMSRAEVFNALGVSLDGLGQIGTGPQSETTTIYALGQPLALYLTWDASDLEHIVLLRAELVPLAVVDHGASR